MMSDFIYPLFFFLIAFVYSSAGFGGGSMYLAALSEASWPSQLLKFTGLLCNGVVTANGATRFFQDGWMRWNKSKYILLLSVVPCVITSAYPLSERSYQLILGGSLLLASLAIALASSVSQTKSPIQRWWLYPASVGIGALAGMTGIGGGVYLAPLLYLTHWGEPKEIAALTSLFILINSIAGLLVQWVMLDVQIPGEVSWLILAVGFGGYFGSRLGSGYFSQRFVKWTTVIIMVIAASRMIWKNL